MAKNKKEKANKGFGKKWKKEQDRLGTFTPLEAGTNPFVITSSEIMPNKDKTGSNYVVEYKALKGPDKGRTFKKWYAFENLNPDTEEGAAKHIASLCDAIGIDFDKFEDPKDALKKKLKLTLKVSPAKDSYGPSNDIQAYLPFKSKDDEDETDDEPKDKKGKKGKKGKKDKKKPF